ncbi:hypothetical protein SRHO_G00329820 [Serrasalmus rhombeus]
MENALSRLAALQRGRLTFGFFRGICRHTSTAQSRKLVDNIILRYLPLALRPNEASTAEAHYFCRNCAPHPSQLSAALLTLCVITPE